MARSIHLGTLAREHFFVSSHTFQVTAVRSIPFVIRPRPSLIGPSSFLMAFEFPQFTGQNPLS